MGIFRDASKGESFHYLPSLTFVEAESQRGTVKVRRASRPCHMEVC